MSNSIRVLVTGSSGFIGSAIATLLELNGYIVVKTTREKLNTDNKNLIYLDLSKPESIINLYDNERFDVIVHFGAKIGWGGESDKDLCLENTISTGLLVNLAKKSEALFIFASAAIVCGLNTELIDKHSPLNADTPYARSKEFAEKIILGSDIKSCILRIGGVFGFKGPKHLGLNNVITQVLSNITPKIYSSNKQIRNYIYVWDVASAVEFVIKNKLSGIHYLSGDEELSIPNMIKETCQVLNPKIYPKNKIKHSSLNQVIKCSDIFPKKTSFHEALQDIKKRAGAS